MRILIVDDESSSRAILRNILSKYGACDLAETGDDAYRKFIVAHGEIHPFGLITLDITMPGLDGNETLARIRRWEEAYRCYQCSVTAKILMVTGQQSSASVFRSFRQGAEDYICKPVRADAVTAALAKLGVAPLAAA
ncbi:MAG: response regulator [Nannocystaceae bacterium]